MPGQRLIDQDERTRKKPMRILVLGMCRTGTTSISVALRKLGYTPHQMRDVLVKPKELALWQEAINVTLLPTQDRPAKQRDLPPYGKSEFDKLLGDYDAIMDLPGCVFAKELIEAYPEAKVILTNRSYADWEQSMQESIWCLDTWRLFTLCRTLNITQLAPLMRLVHSVFRVHNGNNYGGPVAKSAYEKHYDTVRSSVPKDRLLELDTDSDLKWEPLCRFLGNEVPQEQYPSLNEEKAMQKNLENAWWGMVQYLLLMLLLPGLVTVGAVFCYIHRDDLQVLRDDWILGPLKSYLDG
ncbi:uncharacterized protein K460DRAFT_17965 [Cucurbitaria berberidis CBS 394.84]|uniref:P-loop containing nucleoside triphosphate hydrolase protein n=1 Tax=Cucurbitaria berberidis CBS 394.84 TaxID=1168544 RepID=A0A9P4GQ50_9PLEO|nr:uncharacterized protein K460DRAFT_17965 [Cucurbitaria berberidis CBS 394.84]KAF1850573.1 hypothetical protein K460DRAFT_17965 [Cucurbitaria berberidis CBS 394.84]